MVRRHRSFRARTRRAALLVAPGASGLRLVLVHPVPAGGDGRIGHHRRRIRASDRRSARGLGTETLTWTKRAGAGALRPMKAAADPLAGGVRPDRPRRQALLEGWVQAADVAAARARSRPDARRALGLGALPALSPCRWSPETSARSPKAVAGAIGAPGWRHRRCAGVAWIAVPLPARSRRSVVTGPVPAGALLWLRSPPISSSRRWHASPRLLLSDLITG
jgi:hypothetical protein